MSASFIDANVNVNNLHLKLAYISLYSEAILKHFNKTE